MKKHLALALALALVASSSVPASAKADSFGNPFADTAVFFGVGSIAVLGLAVTDIALIVEGIDKLSTDGHGLYQTGAWAEVVLGSLHLIAGAVVLGVGAASDYYEAMVGFGAAAAPPLALGSYLLVHGIWSLENPRPNGPPVKFSLTPHVSDSRGVSGLMASVSGTF